MNYYAIQIFGQKKTPLKREDARHLSAWHSYEKVIRKPAALATIVISFWVLLLFSLWEEYIVQKWTENEKLFKKHLIKYEQFFNKCFHLLLRLLFPAFLYLPALPLPLLFPCLFFYFYSYSFPVSAFILFPPLPLFFSCPFSFSVLFLFWFLFWRFSFFLVFLLYTGIFQSL